MSEILKLWELRAHPFCPRDDEKGEPYKDERGAAPKRDFWLKPLDPLLDERLISFYFDFYDWQYGNLIRKISRQAAFEQFPADADLTDPKSLMIIIQGSEGTGRESLRNLIVHKIKVESGGLDPIVVNAELDSRNHTANLLAIARNFRDACARAGVQQPTRAEFKEIYDEEEKYPNPGNAAFYADLFRRTYNRLRDHAFNPTVLLLTPKLLSPGDIHDVWRVIYNSTNSLFQYVVVMTTNRQNAADCHSIFMRDKLNVSLIVSRELDRQRAEDYLAARLELERNPAARGRRDLTPFTPEALAELFELTEEAKSRKPHPEPKTYNIAQLNRTFICTLDYRLHTLQQAGGPPAEVEETLIGPTIIMKVREMINRGEKCPVPDNV